MPTLNCFFGMHQDEVLSEELVTSQFGNVVIGKVIVNRCKHCGRIKQVYVKTIDREV